MFFVEDSFVVVVGNVGDIGIVVVVAVVVVTE